MKLIKSLIIFLAVVSFASWAISQSGVSDFVDGDTIDAVPLNKIKDAADSADVRSKANETSIEAIEAIEGILKITSGVPGAAVSGDINAIESDPIVGAITGIPIADGLGGITAADSTDIGALFSGSEDFLRADGTTGPGGAIDWAADRAYTADVSGVIHGGVLYICTVTHTAAAATEPDVGADWETVWGQIEVEYNPTNYTASSDEIQDHFAGIDTAIGSKAPLEITLSPDDNTVQSGIQTFGVAGETLTAFQLVYKKPDVRYYAFDADGADIGTYPVPIAMTTSAGAITENVDLVTGVFFLKTSIYDVCELTGTCEDVTPEDFTDYGGVPLYASDTAGEITLTPPATAGDKRIIVGHLWGDDSFIMSLPGMVDVQVPAP